MQVVMCFGFGPNTDKMRACHQLGMRFSELQTVNRELRTWTQVGVRIRSFIQDGRPRFARHNTNCKSLTQIPYSVVTFLATKFDVSAFFPQPATLGRKKVPSLKQDYITTSSWNFQPVRAHWGDKIWVLLMGYKCHNLPSLRQVWHSQITRWSSAWEYNSVTLFAHSDKKIWACSRKSCLIACILVRIEGSKQNLSIWERFWP